MRKLVSALARVDGLQFNVHNVRILSGALLGQAYRFPQYLYSIRLNYY